MISIPWKETRNHQTNHSSSKSTFPFPKDKRFKDKNAALYLFYYLDVENFIIFHQLSVKPQQVALEKAIKYKLSIKLLPALHPANIISNNSFH
jgi:hypothetical protein